MLVIRLARVGRTKYPTYRIVAAESARAATGKFVEVLGHYNPHTKELVMKKERIVERMGNGAQPSNTVVKLLQREKVELPAWVELKTRNRKPKKEPVGEAAPAAEASADAPAEEEVADEAAPVEDEERVAVAATESEAEVEEANATPAGKTETAEDTEAAAEKAEAASNEAAEAAAPAAEEPKEDAS